jgi:hypothetical protein
VVTPADFSLTLSHKEPPRALKPPLAALWWAKKGDWEKAHCLVMEDPSAEAAWVHAYLHRVEGDLGNAGYWYRQAHKTTTTLALEVEWAAIVEELLKR